MAKILMMPAKLATPGFLKIKIFQSKGYDVIILGYDVTNKILSWSHVTKFDNSIISIREVIISSILQGFDQKTIIFEGWF